MHKATVEDVVSKLPTEKGKMTTEQWEQACISDPELDDPRNAMRRALVEKRVQKKASASLNPQTRAYEGVVVYVWRE